LVENSGINQILLNFSSQDHEDFVEWKRRKGNGHVNEQVADSLKKQITSLESSQNPEARKLLEDKREELRELEEKLNQNVQQENAQENKTKVYWGIGGGVVGVGLVRVLIYLLIKRKEKE